MIAVVDISIVKKCRDIMNFSKRELLRQEQVLIVGSQEGMEARVGVESREESKKGEYSKLYDVLERVSISYSY